jgi:hypothetical protein
VEGSAAAAPLRFGVLAAGLRIQHWQAAMLAAACAVPGVELALAVLDANPRPPGWQRKLALLAPGTLLYQWHSRKDGPPRQLVLEDASALFAGAQVMHCRTERRGKWSNYFYPQDLQRIKALELDFLVRFGFNIIRGPVLGAARYGVWSCHFMDEQKYRGQPPCYWECYYGDSEAAAMLQRLTNRLDGGVKLKQVRIDVTRGSIRQNIDDLMAALVPTVAEVCRDIQAGQAAYLDAPPVKTDAPVLTTPDNAQMLRIMHHERTRLARLR